MNSAMLKFCSSGILFGSLAISGCGGDLGVDANSDSSSAVASDVPFAYVQRSLTETGSTSALAYQGRAELLVRQRVSSDSSDKEILASALGSREYDVRDLNVAPDGSTMLFSARTAGSSWNIYQYDFSDSSVRRIISDDGDAESGHDTTPAYTADGDIVFASTRSSGTADDASSLLYRVAADGSGLEQLTTGSADDTHPTPLAEGGLVFIRTTATDSSKTFSLVYLNGESGEEDVLANKTVSGTGLRLLNVVQDSDGHMAALIAHSEHSLQGGDVVLLTEDNTINIQASATDSASSLTTESYTGGGVSIFPEEVSTAGWYSSFWPYRDGSSRMLISWSQCLAQNSSLTTPCTTTTSYNDVDARYGVWTYDPDSNTRQPVITGKSGVVYSDVAVAYPYSIASLNLKPVSEDADDPTEEDNTDDGSTGGGDDDDGSTDDGSTGGGDDDDGSTDDGSTGGGDDDDGSTDDGSTGGGDDDDGSTDDGSTGGSDDDDGSTDDGSTGGGDDNDGSTDDGSTGGGDDDDGSTDDGSTGGGDDDDGSTDDGSTGGGDDDDGSTDDGSTGGGDDDDGSTDDGSTGGGDDDDGSTDDGSTGGGDDDDGSTDDGSTGGGDDDDGSTDDGSTGGGGDDCSSDDTCDDDGSDTTQPEYPTAGSCYSGQGYWKTHNVYASVPALQVAWPEINAGEVSEDAAICASSWLGNLETAPEGNAFYILSHQWIAARLNEANGAYITATISDALSRGEELLSQCSVSFALREEATALAALLNDFNDDEDCSYSEPEQPLSSPYGVVNIRSIYEWQGTDMATAAGGIEALADLSLNPMDERSERFIRILAAGDEVDTLIGYAEVNPDGSALFKVPADTGFRMEVVNARLKAIASKGNGYAYSYFADMAEDVLSVAAGETLAYQPDSVVNPGADYAGAPFRNANPDIQATAAGQTMAEAMAYYLDRVDPVSSDVTYRDNWTDSGISAPAADIDYSYSNLDTTAPASSACLNDWSADCVARVEYLQHIQPLWEKDGRDSSGRSCVACHDNSGATSIDLTWDGIAADAGSVISYQQLFSVQQSYMYLANEFAPVNTSRCARQSGFPFADEPGNDCFTCYNRILMSEDGALESANFYEVFGNDPDHDTYLFDPDNEGPRVNHNGMLSAEELRLISEWLDNGTRL